MCEADIIEQPLTTSFPATEDARLPIDHQILDQGDLLDPGLIPNFHISSDPTARNIGGFGRAAQTCYFLDQTFKALAMPEIDTALSLLQTLDTTLQSALRDILDQGSGKSWHYCTAFAITLRYILQLSCPLFSIQDIRADLTQQTTEPYTHCTLRFSTSSINGYSPTPHPWPDGGRARSRRSIPPRR
jgi:hypothetical protein